MADLPRAWLGDVQTFLDTPEDEEMDSTFAALGRAGFQRFASLSAPAESEARQDRVPFELGAEGRLARRRAGTEYDRQPVVRIEQPCQTDARVDPFAHARLELRSRIGGRADLDHDVRRERKEATPLQRRQ